ncbi:MAG: hypothetical protein V1848_01565 [Candidatus Magasanikbacteria bacterium]
MGENIESAEREEEKEARLEQRLKEAKESPFWNMPLPGIDGWTAGDVIVTIIERLQTAGKEIDIEREIDPEEIYIEAYLEQRLKEAKESPFWNTPLHGINGWTVGQTIIMLIHRLREAGEKNIQELEKHIDPEGIYNDFNEEKTI